MTYRFFDLNTQKVVGPDGYFIDSDLNVYEEEYMYTGGMFEFLPQLKLRPSIVAEPSTGIKDNTGTMIYFGDTIKFLLGSDEHSGLVTHRDATFGVFLISGFVPLNMIVMETIEITGRLMIDLEKMKGAQLEFEQSLQEDLLSLPEDEITTNFLGFNQEHDIVEVDEPRWIEFDLIVHDIECEKPAPTNETDATEDQTQDEDFVQSQEPTNTPVKLQRRPLAAKTPNEIKQPEPHKPSIERKPMPSLKLETNEPVKFVIPELEDGIFKVISITDIEIELRPKASTSNLFKSLIQKVNGNVRLQNFYKKNAIRQMTIQEANELLKRMKEARIQWPK